MPNPLGKKEIGFFPAKGGPTGKDGSAKGAASEGSPGKVEKKTGKKGDPEVKKLLQTLIGVKRSKERATGKPSPQKQKGT